LAEAFKRFRLEFHQETAMRELSDPTRRALLQRFALGFSCAPLAWASRAQSADPPLLSESDPAARAQDYVADASRAKQAEAGSNCANCSIYSAKSGATEGACSLFPGKWVKAAGWCRGWSGL
jgi:hypothetical protein